MNENAMRWLKNAGSFLAVVAVSTGVLWLMSLIAGRVEETTADSALHSRFEDVLTADAYEEIDIYEAGEPYSEITSAYRASENGETKGYIVELTVEGYGGEMEVTVGVSADSKRVTNIKIGSNSETENLGAKVAETPFLSQFTNAAPPFEIGDITLNDGTYFADSGEFENGYKDTVTITVENGRITRAVWDAESESGGKSKRQASIDGEYVMTPDGMLWHEQAQQMESRLIELQSPMKIAYGEDGRTDAIAGVSIKITPFVTLAKKCFELAGASAENTAIDEVSGATVSSRAVVGAANTAVEFVSGFVMIGE